MKRHKLKTSSEEIRIKPLPGYEINPVLVKEIDKLIGNIVPFIESK